MNLTKQQLWERFQTYYTEFPSLELAIDVSRMNFSADYLAGMEPRMQRAFLAMDDLEKGGLANPDEKRMVGHYWLRNPPLAPTLAIRKDIQETIVAIKSFSQLVHAGTIHGANGLFKNLLVIGIGGSALGPQFVANALGSPGTDKLKVYFFDNTDPDGMDRVLAQLADNLGQTLCLVISKSGATKETRNGMLEAIAAYESKNLVFASHAVAVTGTDSELDKYAVQNGWVRRFPMWDWVGGRTSEFSAVGLLPASLQGIDIDSFLAGAKACDEITRQPSWGSNPAAQLSLMWYCSGNGKGAKDMVILPYKDRFELFSRYLQQLVMESIGKERDLDGNIVNQGIAVYGNKGASDQHSYIQQLRDGLNNFFVTFVEVRQDRQGTSRFVEPEVTSGDYLNGFLLGTRQALYDKGRESITVVLRDISPFTVGVLIALFERAVGFYATLVNVNAYNQPGVEAGKRAAGAVIDLQTRILRHFVVRQGVALTVCEIARELGAVEDCETVFKICEHLAANPDRKIRRTAGARPAEATYAQI